MTQPHLEPPLTPLIKEKNNSKSDKYFVKIKLHRDPTSSTSDLYEFKIYLFENGDPEEFLLFVCNFITTLAASGTLVVDTKFQYLCTIARREDLRQFDLLYADV